MDDGKHDILPVAGAILDHARMPVTLPRQSDADMRRDGSTTAQTVPNPPSMSAEECTAHQDSQHRRWIDQVVDQSADAVAEPRKSGYSGEQETKMAEKRKRPPIKRAR